MAAGCWQRTDGAEELRQTAVEASRVQRELLQGAATARGGLRALWTSFQVLGKDSMDYGIRSGKSLRLGMPKAPQEHCPK
ncbi:hypothetical protein TRIUR3_12659 [Triticum urartu]|uniref:Uncharacterized protein n=1 Tax=Triticum urartu TaxID=4572 RepID=M7ZI23_TRIUA|nr:hypothetical protein TRIUR3_12659 [Triticum urartu]